MRVLGARNLPNRACGVGATVSGPVVSVHLKAGMWCWCNCKWACGAGATVSGMGPGPGRAAVDCTVFPAEVDHGEVARDRHRWEVPECDAAGWVDEVTRSDVAMEVLVLDSAWQTEVP